MNQGETRALKDEVLWKLNKFSDWRKTVIRPFAPDMSKKISFECKYFFMSKVRYEIHCETRNTVQGVPEIQFFSIFLYFAFPSLPALVKKIDN